MKYVVKYVVTEEFTDCKQAEELCYQAALDQEIRLAHQGKGNSGTLRKYGGLAQEIGYGVCPDECSRRLDWPRILVSEDDNQ